MRRTTYQVLIMTALCACNGTRTGNPVDKGDDIGGNPTDNHGGTGTLEGSIGNCDPKPSDLGSLDDKTRLGFSANDILAFAAGVHETKIRWQTGGIGVFGPESGEHGLRIEITRAKGKARLVEYEEHMGSGDQAGTAIDIGLLPGANCEGLAAVEIDVDVAIKSDGGALDEMAHGTLRASSTSLATLVLNIDAKDLGGALALKSSKPDGFVLSDMSIDLSLSPLGVIGSLQTTLTMETTGTPGAATNGAAGRGGAALIGDSSACDADGGFPAKLEQKLQQFAAQDAIERVNALKQVALAWQDGAHTQATLAFEHDGGAVCAVLDASQLDDPSATGLLRTHGTLHVSSDDDRIAADWPVLLEAHAADDGALGDVVLTLQSPNLVDAMTLDVEADYGIRGADTSGYDAVQVSFMLQISAGAAADVTGVLSVNGIKHAICPPPPKDPSMGTPGCRGDDITTLESATFGDQ